MHIFLFFILNFKWLLYYNPISNTTQYITKDQQQIRVNYNQELNYKNQTVMNIT